MDIDDVVTNHLCGADSDNDESQSIMTAINVGKSNSTYFYVLNWDPADLWGSGLVFSTESGIWMSSGLRISLGNFPPFRAKRTYKRRFFSICSKLVLYADDDEQSFALLHAFA